MRSLHTALMSLRKSAESRKEMEVLNYSWMYFLGWEDFLSLIYLFMETIPVGALKNQQSQQYLILL